MNKLALALPSETGNMTINDPTGAKFSDVASIISTILPYIFSLAGLALFVFLVIGGFGMLTSAGSPDKMKAAQGKITSAIIGFVIIFIAYWLMRILEIIFGLNLLGA